MPGSVLNLSNAYEDKPLYDEEPMFRPPSRLTGSGRSTPQALGWKSPAPSSSTLQLLNRPVTFNDRDGLRSPLALPSLSDHLNSTPSPPPYTSPRTSYTLPPFPSNPKTPYEVLGVSEYASQEEIKKAYKRLAMAHHPDKCRGNEAAVEEANRRFKLIAEAFAILGLSDHRKEYDLSRKQRSRGTSSSSSRSKGTSNPSFKSSFMPSSSKTSSYSFNSRGEDENDPAPQDFRNLDPFSLFTSMFPQFRNDRTMPERNTQRFPYLDTFGEHDDFLEDLGGFLKDPLLARPSFAGGRKKHSSGCRTVTEKQERAHMDRHGHLEISQSQKTMEVHKSGGFTYSSCSFSGSFGPGVGNGNMLAALMSGGMSMGASRDDGVGSASTGFRGMFGTPDFGDALPQPRTRVRRPSFGALEESIAPHSHSSKPSSRSLTRRSSFGQLNGGISSPAAHALGNDYSLAAYAGFDGEITRYPGW